MKKVSLYLVILLMFISCSTNKTVYLKAIGPTSYEENGIKVSVSEQQEYWIHFDPDTYPAMISFHFDSDILPNYFTVKSVQLNVDKFNIAVKKEINKTIILEEKDFNTERKYYGYFFCDDYLYTKDIIEAWNKYNSFPITPRLLYKEFKNVKEVTYTLEVEYKINNIQSTSFYSFPYSTRNVTSLRLWDTWMSV
ncbi:hypothetical protein [Treponema bryantii]|uniref:hypothetical protein n=1 Tax=Treponema bryantii TaxID=163 RepID=UPI0030C80D47